MKIWNLKRLNWSQVTVGLFAKDGHFRSGGSFSQPRAVFAAHFAVAKWRGGATKWHLCAKGVFRRSFRSYEMGLRLQNWDFEGLGYFAEVFITAKWEHGLRNGTHVPRGGFAAAKFFAGGGYGAVKLFHNGRPISQPTLDFAAGTLWLWNYFAVDGHFRRGLFWAAKFRRPLNFSCS